MTVGLAILCPLLSNLFGSNAGAPVRQARNQRAPQVLGFVSSSKSVKLGREEKEALEITIFLTATDEGAEKKPKKTKVFYIDPANSPKLSIGRSLLLFENSEDNFANYKIIACKSAMEPETAVLLACDFVEDANSNLWTETESMYVGSSADKVSLRSVAKSWALQKWKRDQLSGSTSGAASIFENPRALAITKVTADELFLQLNESEVFDSLSGNPTIVLKKENGAYRLDRALP
ncbi:MAG: hypothetical protein K2W95_13735 [Candidatus Obscuribacterales bacterium]|nr:hypothetical protein [Candidatus Obscuribacterales bacterium]